MYARISLVMVCFVSGLFFSAAAYAKGKDKFQERFDLLEGKWKEKAEKIDKAWAEREKAFLSSWNMEKENAGSLKNVAVGKNGKEGIYKASADFGDENVRVTAVSASKSPEEAAKKARKMAEEKMSKAVGIIAVSDDTGGKKLSDDKIESFVSRNSDVKEVKFRRLNDGMVEAEIEMEQPMNGKKGITSLMSGYSPDKKKPDTVKPGGKYSGLVLDATELDLKPCLIPFVKTEAGKEVYGPKVVDREKAMASGLAAWVTNSKDSKVKERSGSSPLVVKVSREEDRRKMFINDDDGDSILDAEGVSGFLNSCRVSIIVK